MKKSITSVVTVGVFTLALISCGKSDSAGTATNALSNAAPTAAITSPTASGSSGSASIWNKFNKTSYAFIQFSGLSTLLRLLGVDAKAADDTTAPTDVKPYTEMKAEQASDMVASPATVAAKIGTFDTKTFGAKCFNQGHNVTGQASTVNILGGDGGVAYATASGTDTTACMAAYMNALMAGHPFFVNKIFKLQATMLSAANSAGATLPAVGEEKDFKASMPSLSTSSITLSEAKLKRLADTATGFPVYKSSFAFETTGGKAGSIKIWHSPENGDSKYKGRIQAILPHTSGSGSGAKRGLSVVYSKDNGTFTFILKHGANRATTSDTFFNTTTLDVNFDASGVEEDLIKVIGTFNDSTGAGTVWAAWQAGSNDGASRVTMVTTAGRDNGAAGTGYFGYGRSINTGTGNLAGPLTDTADTTDAWAKGMFCAWLTSLSNGTYTTKVQKQTMTYSTATGKWGVNANNWQFARRPDCTTNATFSITGHPLAEVNTTYAALTTPDLVSASTVNGTIPSVTVPTFTVVE